MRLPYTELIARYRAATPVHLPHHAGSLLRGVLGRSLHRHGCTTSPSCTNPCAASATCTYARLFDPPLPSPPPHRLLHGATHPPQPMLPLIPAPGARTLAPGEPFELPLRILGELPPEHEARLVRALEGIEDFGLGRDLGRLSLVEIARPRPLHRVADLQPITPPPSELSIELETPVWITTKPSRRLPLPLSPSLLLHSIHRRLTIVCSLYGEVDSNDDARVARLPALAEAIHVVHDSLRPVTWERHSLDKDQRHPMKGMLGSLRLRGDLHEVAGLLRLAALTHIGKATSHGLGRIRVTMT